MKSKNVKNWRYVLSLNEMSKLDDFDDLICKAIAEDCCLTCGGDKVLRDGLCLGCSMQTTGDDRTISNWLINNVKVDVGVTIPAH